ncbi:MAG: hypothetical protein WCI59_11870 [Betaproteobacteria bacterium]
MRSAGQFRLLFGSKSWDRVKEYTDQGQACYEERYRERVLHLQSQHANKLGMQFVAVAQPV